MKKKDFSISGIKNSQELWDKLWARDVHLRIPTSQYIEKFIRKHIYFKAIDRLLGSTFLTGKNILELGSGTGSNSFYLAYTRKVKSITLVDFSQKAFERVNSELCDCPVVEIQDDILNFFPPQKYDFVHSTGLVEHFYGEKRALVIKKHSECVCSGGLVMIWVPIFSRVFQYIGKFNHWWGIEELPFTEKELHFLCSKSDLEIIREEKSAFGALYGILARKNNS